MNPGEPATDEQHRWAPRSELDASMLTTFEMICRSHAFRFLTNEVAIVHNRMLIALREFVPTRSLERMK